MEQQAAQYWMWMKRKHIMKTRIQASMMMKPYDSWEEQAFAEDAAGPLGGCIWPPRSYSCSFCRREFRSAQALGGHMNVHRRDRARLKQSSLNPQNDSDHHDKNNPCNKSSSTQCPSDQFCSTLDYNHYPNCSTSTSPSLIASSPLSISRVSASSTLDNFSKHTFLSPYSEPTPYDLCTPFGSNNSDKYITKKEEILSTDLSMGMNLVVRRNQPTGSDGDEVISCKRHKNFDNPFPFNPKPCLKLSSMEELDLELRLGDPPKIK